MMIFEFKPYVTIILLIVLWPIMQAIIALLCNRIKRSKFNSNSFFFRTRRWEKNGDIYDTVFLIKKWKRFLPDGAAVTKGGYRKKKLNEKTPENLEIYIAESCRVELQHFLSILPFWIFGLFAPTKVIIIMLLYAVTVNLPCIIAQRYNRPRVAKVLAKIKERENKRKQYSEGTEQ